MYFPIGDIHGAYDPMKRLYDKIVQEIANGIDPAFGGTIVFMGDYVDRGPDSKKVLDFLMNLEDFEVNGNPVRHVILMGNHEEMMCQAYRYPNQGPMLRMWEANGGVETLESFGVTKEEFFAGKLLKYIEWMENLDVLWVDPDYVFVHAGLDNYRPLDQQSIHMCLWAGNRDPDAYGHMNRVVVHGHMIQKFGKHKHNDIVVDLERNRVWTDHAMNMFMVAKTVGLPQPFDYGYESHGGMDYIRIEAR